MRTFLGSLRRDVRGNTLAILAAALIPLAGMVGGGIDLSRMYLTKTRLQHACDAGALAGRKAMGAGLWNAASLRSADQFFAANYATGAYGTSNLTSGFVEAAGKVTGTASAVVPMTLTRVIGQTDATMNVTCEADMRLPNTDIMFVLDTTGSMLSPAIATDTDTKIVALRKAVKCFYEIVARLNSNAVCVNGAPSGGTGTQVQIRFGFMPYSTNVNVGKLLPTAYVADKWFYQSRRPITETKTTTTYPNPPIATTGPGGTNATVVGGWTDTGSTSTSCTAPATTTVGPTVTSTSTVPVTQPNGNIVYETRTTTGTVKTEYRKVTVLIFFCKIQSRTTTSGSYTTINYTQYPVSTDTVVFKEWFYGKVEHTVSGLKNGTDWNDSLSLKIGSAGADRPIDWNGCIEERETNDLDINAIPTPGDQSTLWGPALNNAIYVRNTIGGLNAATASLMTRTESNFTGDYSNNIPYYCPSEAKKLQSWTDPTLFDAYVDGLVPSGNTYHDIGMVWGARFLSPTGIFASQNALTPSGGKIERNLIFMTDGDAQASACDYAAHGVAWFDRRTTEDVGLNTACTNVVNTVLADQINTRLTTLCSAIKNANITLWVISFGSGSNAATETRLSACATPGRYFAARDSATLQNTFANIANQISQLRLTN